MKRNLDDVIRRDCCQVCNVFDGVAVLVAHQSGNRSVEPFNPADIRALDDDLGALYGAQPLDDGEIQIRIYFPAVQDTFGGTDHGAV